MADFAFDEAYQTRVRGTNLSNAGVPGYPKSSDILKVNMLEDISHFMDAIRTLEGPVKDEIRKQLSALQERKAAEGKMNSLDLEAARNERTEEGE